MNFESDNKNNFLSTFVLGLLFVIVCAFSGTIANPAHKSAKFEVASSYNTGSTAVIADSEHTALPPLAKTFVKSDFRMFNLKFRLIADNLAVNQQLKFLGTVKLRIKPIVSFQYINRFLYIDADYPPVLS